MPQLESCRFNGTVTDAAGRVLGEARMWGAGTRGEDGTWTGWIYPADLGGQVRPGRYTVVATDGWEGAFEVGEQPATRVFETDLLAITGIGPAPWPELAAIPTVLNGEPPALQTPWQAGQDIPPFKQPGPNDPAGLSNEQRATSNE